MNKAEQHAETLGKAFGADERETSVLIDHSRGVAYFETTDSFTAKRWCRYLVGLEGVEFLEGRSSFMLKLPESMIRPKPALMTVRPDCRRSPESHTVEPDDAESDDPPTGQPETYPNEIGA